MFFHVTEIVDGNLAVEIGQKEYFDLAPGSKKPGAVVAGRAQRYEFYKSNVVEQGQNDDG